MRAYFLVAALAAATLLVPSHAAGQWYVAGYAGANRSQSSTVKIDQPSSDTHVELVDVRWTSESFKSPQYYGYRIGRLFGEGTGCRWGLEFEFVHPKMFGKTSEMVRVRGTLNGTPVDDRVPMDTIVPRYAMSHGINFALANVVLVQPLGGGASRVALTVRGGAGLTIPHTETTFAGGMVDQYELGGFGMQGGAGIDVRVYRRWSATAEYKVGYSRPEITLAGDAIGRTTAVVHQVAFGIAFGFRR